MSNQCKAVDSPCTIAHDTILWHQTGFRIKTIFPRVHHSLPPISYAVYHSQTSNYLQCSFCPFAKQNPAKIPIRELPPIFIVSDHVFRRGDVTDTKAPWKCARWRPRSPESLLPASPLFIAVPKFKSPVIIIKFFPVHSFSHRFTKMACRVWSTLSFMSLIGLHHWSNQHLCNSLKDSQEISINECTITKIGYKHKQH